MSDPESRAATQDQRDLVKKASKGDLRAFEKIVRSEQDSVRAFLAVRLTRADEAEDLAQETFIVAHRDLKKFDQDRPLRPWLVGIAHNLLRNHLRKFRAEPIGGNEELQVMLDGHLSNQRPDFHTPHVFLDLEDCLEELDPRAKEVIVARYVNGDSVKEIQKRIGKGHSALTMYLHRIRETLGKCILRKREHLLKGN